jgi:iron(III) transport system ATP-binding protein
MTIGSRSAGVVLQGVGKNFNDVIAVRNVDLTIAAGTLVTLLGPSGCGKTTTLRLIAGLEMPTSGGVRIGDHDVTLLPPNERDVSMVFQSYALFPHMTVIENVSYGLRQSKLSRPAQMAKAQEGLKLVGLDGYDSRLPSELSGGQQQRVAVARALVLEPQVLLFDEPLSNLDAKLRRKMREDIRDIQRKLGLTAVYVTHDQEEALAVSDMIVVMNKGVIVQQGTPRDIYERPADAFIADFIGSANLVPAEIVARDPNKKQVMVRFGKAELAVPDRGFTGNKVYLVVRPGAVSLQHNVRKRASLPATIEKATYLGSHWEYTITAADQSLFVTQHATKQFAAGSTVYATLDLKHVAVVERG